MNNYRVRLSFVGVDQRAEKQVEASCRENAVLAATREKWIEVTPGVYCPSANVTMVEVEAVKSAEKESDR
jgi:hypothetical protein